ncbi:sortase [Candidatus Saccharibacteria bacterium]|nr:sortase [Candidatus Saccharibacteria bacterium]
MRAIQKRSFSRTISLVLGVGLLIAGLYLLWTATNPLIKQQLVNPVDNSTTKLIDSTADKISADRLYIPKIDINLPYSTGGAETMENGAWWRMPENGNPRDGGNFVLSAHRFIMGLTPEQTWRKSPFYGIDKLDVGDEIIIDYDGQRYTYQISQKYAVAPTAVEIESRTDDTRLTLYSCTLGGASDGREVIIAKRKS